MAIFFEAQPLNLENIENHDESGRVDLENNQLVVKSGFLSNLGYKLWASICPNQARQHHEAVKKQLKTKIKERFRIEIINLIDNNLVDETFALQNHLDIKSVKNFHEKFSSLTLRQKNLFTNILDKLSTEQQKIFRPILETFAKDILQVMKQKEGNLFKADGYFSTIQKFNDQPSKFIEKKQLQNSKKMIEEKFDLSFAELFQECKKFREEVVNEPVRKFVFWSKPETNKR